MTFDEWWKTQPLYQKWPDTYNHEKRDLAEAAWQASLEAAAQVVATFPCACKTMSQYINDGCLRCEILAKIREQVDD